MNLPKLSVERPVSVAMGLLSVLLLGLLAMARLPLAFLPEVDVPYIVVEVPYPESSPEQVQDEIIEPIEEALATLSGVKRMRAIAKPDGATFELEFAWGRSLDIVRMQVSEKIDVVKPKLPARATTVLITSFNTADIPVVEARISAHGVDLSASYPLLEAHVLDPLRRIEGVARVDLDGVEPRQVYVDLVQARLEEHRVDIGKLVDALENASAEVVLGEARDGQQRFTVRGLGAFRDLDDLASMPIGIGSLRLRDVAEITYEEPPIAFGRHLGREYAVGLSVYKESTANTVDVVDAVMVAIEEEIGADPRLQGIDVFVWENQAEHIRAGIDGLYGSGIVGAALAVVCLWAFLGRLRSTIIVALSIPFSVVAACGVLYFMGKSLNLMSMMGLMLAVGMLVDNAIVVLEAIDRKTAAGMSARQAALEGAKSVTLAVIAATATTLIVFLPLILGGESELTTWLGEVGTTISLALACSLVTSLTLIPLTSALLPPAPPPARTSRAWERIEELYGRLAEWTLRHRVKAGLLLVLSLGSGAIPFVAEWVAPEPFSATVNKRLFLGYEFADFHYKSESEGVVSRVEDYLYEHADEFGIADVYSFYAENEAGTVVVLRRSDLDDAEVKALRGRIREGLPESAGVRVLFDDERQSGGTSTSFSLQLYGRDSESLRALTERTQTLLGELDGMRDIGTSFKHGRQEIQVEIDRDLASRRGVTVRNASEAFGFTLGGLRLPRFRDGEREVDTWLALRIEDRASLSDLQRISFRGRDGSIELDELASFGTVERPDAIVRENRQGNAWVRATYEGEDWEGTRERITTMMNELGLPLGYSWSWDQRIVEDDQQAEQMGTNFLLAVVLIYLVLASLFESLARPFAILLSIVFALPGAAWLLAATSTPLNLMAQIGMLILLGVVVNNGVVLLDRVAQLEQEGHPRNEAFVIAGRDRLRPILMTASTTVLGLVPLALGGSAVGGLFYFPLARTVMGGLVSGAVLTLFGLPLLTIAVDALAAGLRRLWLAR